MRLVIVTDGTAEGTYLATDAGERIENGIEQIEWTTNRKSGESEARIQCRDIRVVTKPTPTVAEPDDQSVTVSVDFGQKRLRSSEWTEYGRPFWRQALDA